MGSLHWGEARIHFSEKGVGPAVLFLHAFPLSSGMWNRQMAALKDHYRAIALDLPGMGKSTLPAKGVTMGGFAQSALAVLDELNVSLATVVGLSMGGYVALEMWAQAPQRIAALALCDTRANADTADGRKAREITARAVEEEGCQVLVERMMPNLLSPAAKPALRRDLEKMILDNPANGAATALRAMAGRRDFTRELPNISCPTLVVVGANDHLTSPAEAQAMVQALPHATLEVIPQAGHLSNLEAPEAFHHALQGLLQKQ